MDLRDSIAAIYRHEARRGPNVTSPYTHREVVDVYSAGNKQTLVVAETQTAPPGCGAFSTCESVASHLDGPEGSFNPVWYDIGFATDLAGNQAYSLRVRSRIIPPTNVNRIFNSLSGGALEQVIPIAPSNATYYPIGVFK
jgi:hypothetical protein